MAIFNKFQRAKQVAEILLRYGLDEFFERSNLEKWLPESLSNKLANNQVEACLYMNVSVERWKSWAQLTLN